MCALQREEALGDGATLSLGVEAAIRRSRHLGGARRTLKRAYALEAEKSSAEVTLCMRAANAGAPFAARGLPGGKQKPVQEGSAWLATSYKAFTTARVWEREKEFVPLPPPAGHAPAARRWGPARTTIPYHRLAATSILYIPVRMVTYLPCCSSSTARSSIPWLTVSSSIPCSSTSTASKVSSYVA
jgi:hypothetical protein